MPQNMPCGVSHPERVAQLIKRRPDGSDEIVLDLLGPASDGAGIVLGEDMEGLYHTPRSQPRKSAAYQEGSTPSPMPRKDERLPKVNLITRARSVAEWEQMETLLWWVLSVDWDCYLRLYDADGNWRELRVRLLNPPSDKSKHLLGSKPFHEWECPLLAYDPFWRSEEVTDTLSRSEMTQDSDGIWVGTVTVSNPSDQAGWLEWASGQIDAEETWMLPDGDSGRLVDLPPQVPGREFWVQTYPERPTLLVRDGSLQWARMRSKEFDHWLAPSTPEERELEVRLVGGTEQSQISLWVPQRWDRPFGGEVLS